MTNTLAIDPGYAAKGDGCACAFVGGDGEIRLWFERPANFGLIKHLPASSVLRVVRWELPQADKRTYHVPPQILVGLTAAGATLAGLYAGRHRATIEAITPSNSKGSVPKPIAHARLLARLSARDLALVTAQIPGVLAKVDTAVEKGARDRWAKPGAAYYPSTWTGHNLLDALDLTRIGRSRDEQDKHTQRNGHEL